MNRLFEAINNLDRFTLNEEFNKDAKKLVDYAKEKGYQPYRASYYTPEEITISNEKDDSYDGWSLEVTDKNGDVLELTLDGESVNVYNLVTGETIEGNPINGSVLTLSSNLDLWDISDFEKDSPEYKACMDALDIDNLDKDPIGNIVKQIDQICSNYKVDSSKIKTAVFDEIKRDSEYREYKAKSKYEEAAAENENLKEDETVEDITWILDRWAESNVDFVTKDQIGSDLSYRTLVKSVNDAERFNYRSDYWGSAEDYQNDNVDLMHDVEPYVGKRVKVQFDDETVEFTVLGILIDKQYNSISHTCIYVEQ